MMLNDVFAFLQEQSVEPTMLLVLSALLTVLLGLLIGWRRVKSRDPRVPLPASSARVLLVIAHPDDECMFFAPTIRALLRRQASIFVLCLSAGNYIKGQSTVRKRELRAACGILGVAEQKVTVIEHTRLPDDPNYLWPTQHVAELVLKYAGQYSVSALLTFDEWGVSLHPNHRAIYLAVRALRHHNKLPADTQLLLLESVHLLRKYSGVLDVVVSRLLPGPSVRHVLVSGPADVLRTRRAMTHGHRSQMLWFRHLYVWFSRYVYVNTLTGL